MPKVTYLLINTSKGKHPWPIAVNGLQTIGHADYDPKFDAHVFRLTEQQWLGGIDRELAEHGNRKFNRWIIRAEVEPDLESPEGKHAQEVDALKAEIARLQQRAEAAEASAQARSDGIEPPAPEAPPIDPENPPAVPPQVDLNLHVKTLDKMASDLGLVVEEPRTRVRLREALEAHYAKQAA
jgi:hypothetical protein